MDSEHVDRREAWRSFFEQYHREEVTGLAQTDATASTVIVDAFDLHEFDPDFAETVFSTPDAALHDAEAVLRILHDAKACHTVRIERYPGLSSIRSLRSSTLGTLVAVEGVVMETHPVGSTLAIAVYRCDGCGARTRERPRGLTARPPAGCDACGARSDTRLDHASSQFVDVQRVTLTEPASDRREEEPWSLDVRLDDNLVGSIETGDASIVTGVLRADDEPPTNRFDFLLDAVWVDTDVHLGRADAVDAAGDLKSVLDAHWAATAGGTADDQSAPIAPAGSGD